MVSREDFLGQQSDHTRSRNRCNKTKITHQLSLAAKPCSLSRSDHNRQIRYLSLPPLSKRESCFSDLLWSRRNRRTAPLHSCRQTLPFSYQQPLFYQNNTTHIEKKYLNIKKSVAQFFKSMYDYLHGVRESEVVNRPEPRRKRFKTRC